MQAICSCPSSFCSSKISPSNESHAIRFTKARRPGNAGVWFSLNQLHVKRLRFTGYSTHTHDDVIVLGVESFCMNSRFQRTGMQCLATSGCRHLLVSVCSKPSCLLVGGQTCMQGLWTSFLGYPRFQRVSRFVLFRRLAL